MLLHVFEDFQVNKFHSVFCDTDGDFCVTGCFFAISELCD